ncbi:hypothetical protein B0H14DRAFT_2570960 [Mycena olivaceomarginata]|nr:hypothetical protein B0H14DRAFT_2570960 [Mycena olivaceomarginata]
MNKNSTTHDVNNLSAQFDPLAGAAFLQLAGSPFVQGVFCQSIPIQQPKMRKRAELLCKMFQSHQQRLRSWVEVEVGYCQRFDSSRDYGEKFIRGKGVASEEIEMWAMAEEMRMREELLRQPANGNGDHRWKKTCKSAGCPDRV